MSLRRALPETAVDLNRTAMIDIVLQLLIFFVMTPNIAAPEGDLSMRMPMHEPRLFEPYRGEIYACETSPIRLTLSAAPDGSLAGLRLENTWVEDFDALRALILNTVNAAGGPDKADLEVELACDDDLHYDHVIQAITAIRGRIERGRVQQLIRRVKFAPPRR